MSDSNETQQAYLNKEFARRQKKKISVQLTRRRCKRKRSLVSANSLQSKSSIALDRSSSIDDDSTARVSESNYASTQPFSSSATATDSIEVAMFDTQHSDASSATDDEIDVHASSSSSSSSDEDLAPDDMDGSHMDSPLPDFRPLYSSTTNSVREFSMDIIEFCRASRLPNNQRVHLLGLFQKYLPSPNLVPLTSADLSGKFHSCIASQASRNHAYQSKRGKNNDG